MPTTPSWAPWRLEVVEAEGAQLSTEVVEADDATLSTMEAPEVAEAEVAKLSTMKDTNMRPLVVGDRVCIIRISGRPFARSTTCSSCSRSFRGRGASMRARI